MGKKKKEEIELVTCDGKIYFLPIEARDLKGGKKITPFCKVYLDKVKKFQTDVMGKTSDPTWNEGARLIVLSEEVPVSKVRFVIMHKATLTKDYVGEIDFEISDLLDGVPRDDWYVLKNKKGTKDMGEMHLQVMYLKKDEDMTKEKDEFPYPLQTLLRKNSKQAWTTLIGQDPDLNVQDRAGQTAVHVCAELDCIKELDTLLEKGADVSIKDNNGGTALHSAAKFGSAKSVLKLIENKIKIDEADNDGKTALHYAVEKNNAEITELLLEKDAKVSIQDKEGNTPLHCAVASYSEDCIPILISNKADVYIKNEKSKSSYELAIDVGETEKETVQDCFYKAFGVFDTREFELKKQFKNRECFEGQGLVGEEGWRESNPQLSIKGEKGAEIKLIMHYEDPVSRVTQPMEKCSFIVFKSEQDKFKELSYWHDNLTYGRLEPITLTIDDESSTYTVIVFSKSISKLSGTFHVIGYSNSNFSITELANWPFKETLENKWTEKTGGGCIEHPTFPDNPKYKIDIPEEKVKLLLCLSQEKNMGDIEPFSIIPYKYHTGLYVFDKDITTPIEKDPIARTVKFRNGRENYMTLEVDGSKHSSIILIPSTFKPKECSSFSLSIGSTSAIKISTLDSIPKAPEPAKKKKRRKKKE